MTVRVRIRWWSGKTEIYPEDSHKRSICCLVCSFKPSVDFDTPNQLEDRLGGGVVGETNQTHWQEAPHDFPATLRCDWWLSNPYQVGWELRDTTQMRRPYSGIAQKSAVHCHWCHWNPTLWFNGCPGLPESHGMNDCCRPLTLPVCPTLLSTRSWIHPDWFCQSPCILLLPSTAWTQGLAP